MLYGDSKLQEMDLCWSCKEETGSQWVLCIEREDNKRSVDSKSASCQLQGICNPGSRNRGHGWLGQKRTCAFSVLCCYQPSIAGKTLQEGMTQWFGSLNSRFFIKILFFSFSSYKLSKIFEHLQSRRLFGWSLSGEGGKDLFRCVVK